jgi:hypothetical protein
VRAPPRAHGLRRPTAFMDPGRRGGPEALAFRSAFGPGPRGTNGRGCSFIACRPRSGLVSLQPLPAVPETVRENRTCVRPGVGCRRFRNGSAPTGDHPHDMRSGVRARGRGGRGGSRHRSLDLRPVRVALRSVPPRGGRASGLGADRRQAAMPRRAGVPRAAAAEQLGAAAHVRRMGRPVISGETLTATASLAPNAAGSVAVPSGCRSVGAGTPAQWPGAA